MWYEVRKMVFYSFDTMVENACRIEDVWKEQEILTKHGNNNNNNSGQNKNNPNKDKGNNSHWNRKNHVVNDGVVDSSKPNDQVVFHLSSAIQAMKLNASNQ